eukprot:8847018-Alexandrium_andersonii.AAC.1
MMCSLGASGFRRATNARFIFRAAGRNSARDSDFQPASRASAHSRVHPQPPPVRAMCCPCARR